MPNSLSAEVARDLFESLRKLVFFEMDSLTTWSDRTAEVHKVWNGSLMTLPLLETRAKASRSFQFQLCRISTSVFVWFIHPVKGRYNRCCSTSRKERYCSIKQGVRHDLTYHIASMNSRSFSPIMCICFNDIEEGSIGVLVHLAVLRKKSLQAIF